MMEGSLKIVNGDNAADENNRGDESVTEPSSTSASGSDVLTLSIGGSRTVQVLRSTLTYKEESLLAHRFSGRWDDSLARDAHGNFFMDEDPTVFVPLLEYLRDISRQTCLTAELEPPVFQDAYLEKRFRVMVDHYGLTDAFYPVALFKKSHTSAATRVVSRDVLQYDISEPTVDNNKHYYIDLLRRQRPVAQVLTNAYPCACFERKFKAFEATIRNPTVGDASIGWMRQGSTGHASRIYFSTGSAVPFPRGPEMSYYTRAGREDVAVPGVTWTANQAASIRCCKLPDGHLVWSVQGSVVARTIKTRSLEREVGVVLIEWNPPTHDVAEMIPYVAIYGGCHLGFSGLDVEF